MIKIILLSLMLFPMLSSAQEYLNYISPTAKYLKNQQQEGEILIATKAELDPENPENSEILHANDYNRLLRVEANLFSNESRGNGQQLWVMYRSKISQKWELIAKVDSLNRYDLKDQRVTGGVVRHFDKKNVRVEVSKAIENILFANSSVEVEYVTPVTKKLVGYVGGRYSDYDTAGVVNFLAYLAAEYYVAGNNMIFARMVVSEDKFNTGAKDRTTTGMVRFTHFINDFDKVFIFGANSADSILRNYNNSIDNAEGVTFGAGYSRRVGKSWIIEFMAEEQRRRLPSGKDKTKVFTVAVTKLWK